MSEIRLSDDEGGDLIQVLSLVFGGTSFAVETDLVLEVLDEIPLVHVPNSKPHVKGLINMRGKVIPVVDLQVLLGMTTKDSESSSADRRIVVLTLPSEGEQVLAGAIADRVHKVLALDKSKTQSIPTVGVEWNSSFIKYIGKNDDEFIIVLDIEKVFAPLLG
jgi:purine-binding chemotaxis protein CheW